MRTEGERRAFFDTLTNVFGSEHAEMAMHEFNRIDGIEFSFQREAAGLRAEMAGLRGDMTALAAGLRGEMAEVRGEMGEVRGEMGEVRGGMAGLRGEMAELRGKIDSQVPKLIMANAVLMIPLYALVLRVLEVV